MNTCYTYCNLATTFYLIIRVPLLYISFPVEYTTHDTTVNVDRVYENKPYVKNL